jgi:hypothetical protein
MTSDLAYALLACSHSYHYLSARVSSIMDKFATSVKDPEIYLQANH